ncbi:hypothetical protein [Pleurocapsa sp. PCC 7319]|uniref:hypothetical protein n=1 Tax=Pleurocapsa sp. PCC 7319 TaxID=118161 RepID=UPI0003497B68|nr:hypothetical protein [Pleurocapsa sp. PCC 7319]
MVERLKRWETPRKRGRNDKGKGGSARARQLRKREQMLRQKLKNNGELKPEKQTKRKRDQQREIIPSLFFGKLNAFFFCQ